MDLLSVLIALGFIQFWGSGGPLQRDEWFWAWGEKSSNLLKAASVWAPVLTLIFPVLLLSIVVWAFADLWHGTLLLFINIPVLLYSFGRGDFSTHVNTYLETWRRGDLQAAYQNAVYFRGACQPSDVQSSGALHCEVKQGLVFRGFERLFVVLFWFLLTGAAGALLYRLVALYCERFCALGGGENDKIQNLRWLLEWLPVRLLGLTLAVVGNFTVCFPCWKESFQLYKQSSADTLWSYAGAALRGAGLGRESEPEQNISKQRQLTESAFEIESLVALLSRCLMVWLGVLAVLILIG